MFDPVANIPEFSESLHDKTIVPQVGTKDEFSINVGIKAMSSLMDQYGIRHALLEYNEGHLSIDYLYVDSLPLLVRDLS